MRIAIINPWAISSKSIGGTERFVEDLAISLNKLGHKVDVYMFSGNNHISNSINYISLNLFGKNAIADEYMILKEFGTFDSINTYTKIAKKIEKLIDCEKYDFLHLNSHFFLKCWQHSKRIFTLHSNFQEFKVLWSDEEFKKMVELMNEEVKNKNTYFVSPSIYYSNEWSKLIDNKIYYIPHALNKERLVCLSDKKDLLKKYNLSGKKIKILLPSRLEPIQKQPMLILQACALLEKKYKDKLQIIFTGIDEQYKKYIPVLKQFADINGIDSKFITFDKFCEAYALTDIVAVPSKSESFGYSALESLSLGIKTILSDIPTFNEISEKNSCAYIFDNSSHSLSLIIKNIIEENNYVRRNIPLKWSILYSIETFGKKYIEVLRDE